MTTVLLVEDDPAISEPLARAFGREGYEVLTHGTGKGALEEVSAADIIVLDLGLPDIDGLDVARQVRAQGLTIPILMLTARSETPTSSSVWTLGLMTTSPSPSAWPSCWLACGHRSAAPRGRPLRTS